MDERCNLMKHDIGPAEFFLRFWEISGQRGKSLVNSDPKQTVLVNTGYAVVVYAPTSIHKVCGYQVLSPG